LLDTEKSKGLEVPQPVLAQPSGNVRKPPPTSPKPVMMTINEKKEITVSGSDQTRPCLNGELAQFFIMCTW